MCLHFFSFSIFIVKGIEPRPKYARQKFHHFSISSTLVPLLQGMCMYFWISLLFKQNFKLFVKEYCPHVCKALPSIYILGADVHQMAAEHLCQWSMGPHCGLLEHSQRFTLSLFLVPTRLHLISDLNTRSHGKRQASCQGKYPIMGRAMAPGIPWWLISTYLLFGKRCNIEAPRVRWNIVFVDFFLTVVLGCDKIMCIAENLPYTYWKTFSKEYFC